MSEANNMIDKNKLFYLNLVKRNNVFEYREFCSVVVFQYVGMDGINANHEFNWSVAKFAFVGFVTPSSCFCQET